MVEESDERNERQEEKVMREVEKESAPEINTLLLGAETAVATVSLSFLLSWTRATHGRAHTRIKTEQVYNCENDRFKVRLPTWKEISVIPT